MRIFLSYSYPPMHYPRAIQVGRLVDNMKSAPIIYCLEPDNYEPIDHGMNIPNRNQVRRVPKAFWDRILMRILNRCMPYLTQRPDRERLWSNRVARCIVSEENPDQEDILITFSNPLSDHLAGLYVKTNSNCYWIASFSDPWVDNQFLQHDKRSENLARKWERDVFAKADRLIFTSAETIEMVMARYPEKWKNKCRIVEHSFSPKHKDTDADSNNKSICIRHIGNLYGSRSAVALVKALAVMVNEKNSIIDRIRIELIGHVEQDMTLFPDWSLLPERLIKKCPPVSYEDSIRLMDSADLLLVLNAPANHSPFLPSKLVEYIGANVPIVAVSPPGTTARLVSELGGIVADPQDIEAIISMLVKTEELSKNRNVWRERNESIRNRYTPKYIASEFEKIIQELE